MAKKKRATRSSSRPKPAHERDPSSLPLGDIRHPSAKRKNIPPARLASEGTVPALPKAQYAYNPHLPPVLRFDQHAAPDALPELINKARSASGGLTDDEARLLADALRRHEPWLEWTGKREQPSFSVDPVALHIHERISAQAILKVAARQDASKSLFADPEQEYHEAVQFYRHDVDWANRLILGDSLQVMSSLARREDLAGKVQMIYMDPPYGIKFASNFQPEVGRRDVKDKQEDLTREPEMVRAYRDTWRLGVHSYLSYLRDRLIVTRELLADTGSIFVQISDENLHRVRSVMDEVFGSGNFITLINFAKTSGATSDYVPSTTDYLLWYARNRESMKYRAVHDPKTALDEVRGPYSWIEEYSGERRRLDSGERDGQLVDADRLFRLDNLQSQSIGRQKGIGAACWFPVPWDGKDWLPGTQSRWKTNEAGLVRLRQAERLAATGGLYYVRFLRDFPVKTISNSWGDTGIAGFASSKVYVVETSTKVIERCMLMTTDPGDLVLDPTCGSGTTAFVAEQWGRRWITIDTSRVAVSIARQRLLTSKFDHFKTKATQPGRDGQPVPDPSSGFHYKTVPHITLKSIAQNVALDPIFARHEPLLDAALDKANKALADALKRDPSLPTRLAAKLARKEKDEGKRSITDADRRRWTLPPENRDPKVKWTIDPKVRAWYHWEVPFDTDPDWPQPLQDAVTAYRAAWRAKMDEVNACIEASAQQEELVDQPEIERGVTRVSGPFTVEAVQPPEMSLGDVLDLTKEGAFAGEPDELDRTFAVRMMEQRNELEVANISAYLDQMYRFIKADGVRFLNNKQMKWTRLDAIFESGAPSGFHAEGRWAPVGDETADAGERANVAVLFGPQYGPVTGPVVIEALRQAHIHGYEHVVIAGFSFDGAAQTAYDNQAHPKVKMHLAHIRPDINPGMEGLLKDTPKPGSGQLFTVFGKPRITIRKSEAEPGSVEVEMEGVDIYDPVTNEIRSSTPGKVAAWFLDGDYDGRTFCVTQAFFPDKTAWEKLSRALNGKNGPIDSERFEAFSGTTSLPFPPGKEKCVAVKVIDPRGNEVMAVERLR